MLSVQVESQDACKSYLSFKAGSNKNTGRTTLPKAWLFHTISLSVTKCLHVGLRFWVGSLKFPKASSSSFLQQKRHLHIIILTLSTEILPAMLVPASACVTLSLARINSTCNGPMIFCRFPTNPRFCETIVQGSRKRWVVKHLSTILF